MLRKVKTFEDSSNIHHELRMPHLPDPANTDNQFVQNEKLDFSISLGSTLARGDENEDVHTNRPLLSERSGLSSTHASNFPTEFGKRRSSYKNNLGRQTSRRGSIAIRSITSNAGKETALMKIQRVFKTVKIISSVCLALKRYVEQCESKTWSFIEMYLHVKEDLNQLVAFNPHSFAKVEPERLKLKKLLHIQPQERTSENIKVILALLRDNKSFQEYPCRVQVELARCMTYQSYEARRVVLRQGHRPEAFYIVLSGFVMTNVEDISPTDGKKFVKTVKEMGPGDTFGELALIEGGRQTSTMVCKTTVELLVILKDDFDSIIKAPLVKQIDAHIAFCRTVPLFQDFPCEKLAENPSQFFYHFFRKGDIVVKDSKESKYIIAVKTGKCKVISRYTEKSKTKKKTNTIQTQKDMDAAFPDYQDMKKIMSLHPKSKTDTERLKESICLGLVTGQIDKVRLADHGPDVKRPKSSMTPADVERKVRPPLLEKSKTLSHFFDAVTRRRQNTIQTDEDLHSDVNGKFWGARLQYSRKSKKAKKGYIRNSSARSASSRYSGSTNPFYTTEKYSYAEIAELGTGTVFIQTYPSKEFIEQQVQNYRSWQQYKCGLVQAVLNRRH